MAKNDLFELFFDPVFQKCLIHAQNSSVADGIEYWIRLSGFLCGFCIDGNVGMYVIG